MYGPTIDSLIRSGVVVLLHDYRSGSAKDWGSYGTNGGILSSGCRFTGPSGALRFPAATDEVTVADAPELRLTAGSIVAVAGQGGFTSQVNYERIFRRFSVTQGFVFAIHAAQMVLYGDGPAAKTVTTSVIGTRSIGCTFSSGDTPIAYKDGISAGNFSGALTFTAAVGTVEIGNWNNGTPLRSPLSCLLLANRILTPTEMAACHAELLAARWPSKQYSIGKRMQGSVIGEANLLAGYTLRPSGLSVPSHDGAFTGTISGQAQHVNSILGDALSLGRVTGAVDLGVGNAQIDPTTDSHWVEVWARPLDVAMVDAYSILIGKKVTGWGNYVSGGIEHSSTQSILSWRNGGGYATVTAAVVPRNKLTHYLYQFDYTTGNAYLYIDGVQYGPTAIGAMIATEGTNWNVGKCGGINVSYDEGFGGLVINPRIGTGVLTPAQVQARYLEGAKAVQFKTDWGYSISPADEGGVTGQQIGGNASPFRAGDATGRWAVETDTIEGRLCKVLTCKTAGTVYIPASYFHQATATEASFGTFKWWFYKAAATDIVANFISEFPVWNAAGNDGYVLALNSLERVALQYTIAGVTNNLFTSANDYFTVATWHAVDITRSLVGSFSVYIDRALVTTITGANPVTNTSTTVSNSMGFAMGVGDKIALGDSFGNHGIVKMLGVVAP